jgi:hypothetical protein
MTNLMVIAKDKTFDFLAWFSFSFNTLEIVLPRPQAASAPIFLSLL